jgi:molybdate transport system substrate-binding protein
VRKGAAKPDISSADAFKRSMLVAKAIDYTDPASGAADGIYLARLFDRLGIAAEMKPKTKLLRGSSVYASVASGEVDIGFQQISEILAEPSVEFIVRCRRKFRTSHSLLLASSRAAHSRMRARRWLNSCLPRLL